MVLTRSHIFKYFRHFRIFIVLSLLLPLLFSAAEQETKTAAEEPAKHYQIRPATGKIKVDGIINEADWLSADIIKLPFEWLPGDNIPAPVETDCLITFSRSHLFIAFRCYDPEPQKIRAHLMDRDSIDTFIQDDHISIMIDTFNDERRGFQFRVNPLGVQADANFSELEGYEDFSWDAIWESKGRISDSGYTIEIAIPFNQLRFAKSSQPQTWGFSAERSYPRNVRHRVTSHKRLRDRNCILCQFNKISGFTGMSPGKNLEIAPTLTANRTDNRVDFPNGDIAAGDIQFEPGLSARWGITSNLMVNATVNPDFSQVEADVAQLEVNTRFALRYPEKRPFFLEGADFFLTPLEAVFTRTIYDPYWGAKVTSKFGKNALGVFATQDSYNNLLFPSNQGSLNYAGEENVFNGVVRYRRDIGSGSTLGILYTGRAGDQYQNQVAGFDGFLRLSRTKTLNFQYLLSNTSYPDNITAAYSQPEEAFTGGGLSVNFSHNSRNWGYSIAYQDISPRFRADSGFIPRVDVRNFQVLIMPMIWGSRGGWFTRLNFPIVAEYTVDYDGNRTDQTILFQSAYQGPLQSNVALSVSFNKELYSQTTYDLNRLTFQCGFKPAGGLNINFISRTGDSIDYTNARLASSLLLMPSLEWGIGKHINLNVSHIYERLALEGEPIYTANLFQTRLVYNFSTRAFVRGILQYTHIDRNTDLYLVPVDPQYKGLFSQFLFSYKINPQTVLFLGYSDNYMGFKGIDMTQLNRTFFLKIGYALIY